MCDTLKYRRRLHEQNTENLGPRSSEADQTQSAWSNKGGSLPGGRGALNRGSPADICQRASHRSPIQLHCRSFLKVVRKLFLSMCEVCMPWPIRNFALLWNQICANGVCRWKPISSFLYAAYRKVVWSKSKFVVRRMFGTY